MKHKKQEVEKHSTHTAALYFLVAVVLIICLVYVLQTRNTGVYKDYPQTETGSSATTENNDTELAEDNFETISSSSTYYEVSAETPIASSTLAGAETIRKKIQGEIGEFISQANEQGPEIEKMRGQPVAYQKDLRVSVYESGDVTSYYLEDYSFTGGANGNAVVQTFNFNDAGEEVSSELITPSQESAFLSAVKEELRGRDFGASDTFGSIIDELTLADLSIHLNGRKEIVVAFSEYAVAPGAAGIVTVTLPTDPYITNN